MIGLTLIVATLASVDVAISYFRMRRYGPPAELNPLAAKAAAKFGPIGGAISLGVMNTLLIAGVAIAGKRDFMAALAGAKLGLLAMQMKSYHLESMVETKLREILKNTRKK